MLSVLSRSTFLLGIATVLNYIALLIFARTGGPEAFSRYLLAITVATALSVIINYSSQRVFTRDVLETGSEQRSFNTIMSVRLILGFVGIVGLIMWGYWSAAGTPLAVAFLIFYIFQLNFLFEYYATNSQLAAITLLEKLFFCLTASSWAIFFGFSWHVYGFFLLGSVIALFLQFKHYPDIVRSFRLSPTEDIKRYAKLYADLVIIDLVQLTYGNFSRLIIQHKKGLLDFGAVSIGFQIIKIASIFQTQVEYIFRPQTIKLCAGGDLGGLRKHAFKYLWMTTLPTAFGSAFLILLAEPIIILGFGQEFAAAIQTLKIIAVLPVLVNLMRFLEMIFIGLSQYRINLLLNLITSFGLLVGLFALPVGSDISLFLWLIVAAQTLYIMTMLIVVVRHLTSQQMEKKRHDYD